MSWNVPKIKKCGPSGRASGDYADRKARMQEQIDDFS